MKTLQQNVTYVLRSNDLSPDPRVEKYVHFFKAQNRNYRLVGWNRSFSLIEKANTAFYHSPAGYGMGMKNIIHLIRWNIFLFRYLVKHRKNIGMIHACDFDTVLPALLVKKLYNVKVIFDVFDWYSDSRKINSRFLVFLIGKLEHWCVKYCDIVIVCEEERIEQLGPVDTGKVHIMQNIPDFPVEIQKKENKVTAELLKISYVGILSNDRGLEVLLKVVSALPFVHLEIAGFGELENLVSSYAVEFPNITFRGKIPYETGLQLMNESDCIYAMYYKNIKNHIYAAPNKFYESLYLGKPLITTLGTLVGSKVEKYQSGFVIEEGYVPLYELIEKLTKEECRKRGKTAALYWQKVYRYRIADFLEKEYALF